MAEPALRHHKAKKNFQSHVSESNEQRTAFEDTLKWNPNEIYTLCC